MYFCAFFKIFHVRLRKKGFFLVFTRVYVCVKAKLTLCFFFFFAFLRIFSKFSMYAWEKNPKMLVFSRVYVRVKAKLFYLSLNIKGWCDNETHFGGYFPTSSYKCACCFMLQLNDDFRGGSTAKFTVLRK